MSRKALATSHPPPTVDRVELEDLNHHFYGGDGPADYFSTRLNSLMALVGNPDDFADLLRTEVQVDNVTFSLGAGSEIDTDALRRYLRMESQVLLHHAAEALIRLFLAHRHGQACPWLEIAAEFKFREFKDAVQQQIVNGPELALTSDVGFVFLGRREAPEWATAAESLTRLLRRFARDWLADARLYNSAKHGLSVVPGDAVFNLGPTGGDLTAMGHGDSLAYLEAGNWIDGTRTWSLTTRWIDVSETLGLIHVSTRMMTSLWDFARFRYCDEPPPSTVFDPTGISNDTLRSPGRAPAHRFSISVLKETREP